LPGAARSPRYCFASWNASRSVTSEMSTLAASPVRAAPHRRASSRVALSFSGARRAVTMAERSLGLAGRSRSQAVAVVSPITRTSPDSMNGSTRSRTPTGLFW
jgi:hypothetical protein